MSIIAAGMESDFSDSDYDTMVFSYSDTSNQKNGKRRQKNPDLDFVPVPAEVVAANGYIKSPQETVEDTSLSKSDFNKNHPKYKHKKDTYHKVTKNNQPLDDLRYAIIQGNVTVVKQIIENGVEVDCILKSGWTGLMYACSSAADDIVLYFLEKGANPNYHKDNFTSLMATCASKKLEANLLKCCQYLLKYKAEVNVYERHLTTPLMFAAREGHLLIVQELLNAGADIKLRDNRGRTALMWAACSGYGQIVRLLLNKGADPNDLDSYGQTSADLALQHDYTEIAALLEKSCSAPETLLEVKEGLEFDTKNEKMEAKLFPQKPKFQQNSKCYAKQNELEIFLKGLGQPELIDIIKEHQLTFYQFIVLSEDELEKIGIDKIGVRKQILEAAQAVHKERWRNSSLPNLKQLPYISCPDAVAMIANVDEHLKQISSQIVYIRLQIQSDPRALELQQDTANVHNLVEETESTLKNIKTLYDELRFLKRHLNKIQGYSEFAVSDLINDDDSEENHHHHKVKFAFGIFILSVTLGGIMWKQPDSLRHVSSFIVSKVPFLKSP